ncbi:transcription factor [Niveomyces insectorum RCEF 264]|uniref:Transcription factor n=1 Tax=Niveomyces insectorum RCEF 264 TaxID=1081102 RepID=A0A168A4R5_9HYPO|nr:transcription factor [Niveomyces insectorum RCEF 264]
MAEATSGPPAVPASADGNAGGSAGGGGGSGNINARIATSPVPPASHPLTSLPLPPVAQTQVSASTSPSANPSLPPSRPSIAVGLHEAALDSPSFRASAVLFGEQIDAIERWLESYVKSTAKLVHDFAGLEDSINHYLAKIVPPAGAADCVIDADHTLLALQRVSDGSRDWWAQVANALRRFDAVNAEPIRGFLHGELRNFKETRRALEHSQKTYDATLARYVGQSKTKEPSALREDAFSLYETRRAYLKTSMDFCQAGPQLRSGLDKLLTRVSADFWRDMKRTRDTDTRAAKWGEEMERIRGWAKEIELSEAALRRELQVARRDVGETTLATIKPSRELDDYSASTVPFLGSRGPVNLRPTQAASISEKQGWLFLRTVTGKPARVNWVHRWFYCRDGIFGWLVQGPQGVLQGDDIGVLLCSAKPAVQEERRFCFEVKTKSQNLTLQAETQGQLIEWLEVFEVAKKKAFEASMARDNASLSVGGVDPAFAITPPAIADFSARALEMAALPTGPAADDAGASLGQTAGALTVPGGSGLDGPLLSRSSFDVSAVPPRRSITTLGQELRREEGESSREHASRIMQKLDLHRKSTFASGAGDVSGEGGGGGRGANMGAGNTPSLQPSGGIASLISASHSLLPVYPLPNTSGQATNPYVAPLAASQRPVLPLPTSAEQHRGCLAPTTFTKSPVQTFLSKVAVTASSEHVLGRSGCLPAGILANYWGSSTWGSAFVAQAGKFRPETPAALEGAAATSGSGAPGSPVIGSPATTGHRKTVSVDAVNLSEPKATDRTAPEVFPPNYPAELKSQHAQFRLLFPSVPLDEKLVLVFNAAWASASDAGTAGSRGLVGSGRVYVSADNMYFYSQTMGLVATYAVSLDIITEVTAAPGKDCDYIFLHLGQDANDTGFTRITIKTFLEDMYLLQARINLLIDDLQAAEPMQVPGLIAALQNLANDEAGRKSPSIESWDDGLASPPPPHSDFAGQHAASRRVHDWNGRRVASGHRTGHRPYGANGGGGKFQLPAHPVVYEPDDMQKKVAERHFEISAKACFHVLFGDKSFIFPKLYFERRARAIEQGPWNLADHGKMKRQFRFVVEVADMLGRKKDEAVVDEQTIDVFSDHATYVVTHVRRAWHLPHSSAFKQVLKVVITHVAKSKCKLAIYVKVDWSKAPPFSRHLVERQALDDASRDADELAEVATDEVRKLGSHSRTKRAIQVYGNIGQQTQAMLFTPGENGTSKKTQIKPRTLTEMVLETFRSFMESVVTSLVMWAFAGCRKLFHIATVYRILLVMLALSVATNLVFSSRETAAWWTERHATKFMRSIGVGPNTLMSKSIYLADLNEAAQGAGLREPAAPEASICYETFLTIANTTNLDGPSEDAGALLSSATSRATAQRLRRTRQKLGSYRHDLLVAMRVVNSIEREMVQSEWENWLADETQRCDQVNTLLVAKKRSASSSSGGGGGGKNGDAALQKELDTLDEKRTARLADWYEDYCGSCRADRQALETLEWHKSML